MLLAMIPRFWNSFVYLNFSTSLAARIITFRTASTTYIRLIPEVTTTATTFFTVNSPSLFFVQASSSIPFPITALILTVIISTVVTGGLLMRLLWRIRHRRERLSPRTIIVRVLWSISFLAFQHDHSTPLRVVRLIRIECGGGALHRRRPRAIRWW